MNFYMKAEVMNLGSRLDSNDFIAEHFFITKPFIQKKRHPCYKDAVMENWNYYLIEKPKFSFQLIYPTSRHNLPNCIMHTAN